MAVIYERNYMDTLPDEKFKPLVYQGTVFPKYKVSQYGGVIGPRGKKLKWQTETAGYPIFSISLTHKDRTSDKLKRLCTKTMARTMRVHRVVAETWMPIKENLPYLWQPMRYQLTDEHFELLTRMYVVDHIDGDPANPFLSNLQWVTTMENNSSNKPYFMKGLEVY